MYRKAVRMGREVYARPSLQFARLSREYGQFLIHTGRLDSAEGYVQGSMEAYQTLRPAGHPDWAGAVLQLGTLQFRQGDLALGDSLARRSTNGGRIRRRQGWGVPVGFRAALPFVGDI